MAIHWPGKTYKACATRAMHKNEEKNDMKREVTTKIEGYEVYPYPEWYYSSKREATAKRICHVCGNPLPKGKRAYCSFECSVAWKNYAGICSLQTNSMRREIHKRFGFTCQKCGKVFYSEMPSGVMVPRFWGDVHHIIPLQAGGKDEWSNMTLLCNGCHKEVHGKSIL
jgi:5-methylcytosine-specific restriction endonuclease McrA